MSAEPVPHDVEQLLARIADLEAEVQKERRARNAAVLDLANAEIDLRASRRKYKELLRDRDAERRADELYPVAHRLWEWWKTECGHKGARTFNGDRLKNVMDRLKDKTPEGEVAYPPKYIAKAIRGAAWHPTIDRASGKRYDELALICRSGEKLEDFRGRFERGKP